ncbi:PIG-L deacetylase family protein [Pengzhenrongella frigida]|uniref:PIG-L family deacetylase n=1 Tax=Pengzhenrongella frigida TaxID=1259133 RepID=A0A4Q5MVL7_9MICO|nr:PIG-L deacetylase family protein [Cellulomonas sp. HLT2-17]RYV49519.1 PIG-L family deacetylase [Cellulomonas sp. HLT2-17]
MNSPASPEISAAPGAPGAIEHAGPPAPGLIPPWGSVLVVVAHPDDESFGLGAVISHLLARGTAVTVLCLTKGEASTLHGIPGELAGLRQVELQAAAEALGGAQAALRGYPDGGLAAVPAETLVQEAVRSAGSSGAQAVLVFDVDGVTGHPDHAAASRAGVEAAGRLGLPVLAWTLPTAVAAQLNDEFAASFTGHRADEVDLVLPVDRSRQRVAIAAHASQAVPSSVLWRRLELLGAVEHLRWVHSAGV